MSLRRIVPDLPFLGEEGGAYSRILHRRTVTFQFSNRDQHQSDRSTCNEVSFQIHLHNYELVMAESVGLSMAATYQAARVVPKSAEELKKARETRAAEALRMKEEQLRILSDQNASLLSTLDKVNTPQNVSSEL